MATQNEPLEKTIVASIMRWLKKQPDCHAEKRHGGMYGSAGRPDITGCVEGRRFEIEVKRPSGKTTKLQEIELAKWKQAGAITGVARSLSDAKEIFEKAKRKAGK